MISGAPDSKRGALLDGAGPRSGEGGAVSVLGALQRCQRLPREGAISSREDKILVTWPGVKLRRLNVLSAIIFLNDIFRWNFYMRRTCDFWIDV
jgi:hypothetical protein